MEKRTTIKRKITLVVSLLIVIVMFFVGLLINYMVGKQLVSEIYNRGKVLVKNIASNSKEAILINDELSIALFLDKLKDDKSIVYGMVLDRTGVTIAHTDLSVPCGTFYDDFLSVKAFNWESEEPLKQWGRSNKYGYYLDISVPIMSENAKMGIVRLGFSGWEILKSLTWLTLIIAIIALIGVFFSVIITNYVVTKITYPIKSLTKGAQIIGNGNLDFVIKNQSGDEIGQLASAFNEMTSKLKIAQKEIIEKEKMKQELEIARGIQQSLLPKESPEVKGYELESFYRSAKEIGGDYYDFLPIPGNKMGIVIADVSGKGVPGSLGMAITRSIFRTQVEAGGTAGEILVRTNELVYKEIKRGIFVSMFFSVLDIENGTLNCASAGHNPPLILYGNKCDWFDLGGLALGVGKGQIFKKSINEKTIKLNTGDMIIHYTDGVTEAKDDRNEDFGENRLKDICEKTGSCSAKIFNEELLKAVERHIKGTEQSDDITIVTLRKI